MALPNYQVQLVVPGLMGPTHHAFAVRLDDYLVYPLHARTEGLLVKSKVNKVLIPLDEFYAVGQECHDMVFQKMNQETWSKLGVKSGKIERLPDKGTSGRLISMRGAVHGMVTRAANILLMVIQANTQPGDSGAPYISTATGNILALHTGASSSGQANVGYSGYAVERELKNIVSNDNVSLDEQGRSRVFESGMHLETVRMNEILTGEAGQSSDMVFKEPKAEKTKQEKINELIADLKTL